MSKEKCSKNEVFNRFEKKCESKDSHKGILLNSKSGKYKFLKKNTLEFFLELNLEELKTYCKEMIPTYDCSKIQNKKDLIKLISNKINIETGDLFCKSDEFFDKKDRKCSKIPTTPPRFPEKIKSKSPQMSKTKSPQMSKTKSPKKTKSKSPKVRDEHNYAIIFLKKAKQEDIVTKLNKKNIDRNVEKLNKYIKKMVFECEKRIKLGKIDDENKKVVISKYFQKYVMSENVLKPLFSDLFSIEKYSEENYHLMILMEIFILYILNNNITEFIEKEFEISDKAELKTKMYFKKSKTNNESKPFENNIVKDKFNIKILIEDLEPVSYIKYVDKYVDILMKYKLIGGYNDRESCIFLQELLLECDIKFKELLDKNPPKTYDEFKIFIDDFMKKYLLNKEDKITRELIEKEIFYEYDKGDEEKRKKWLMVVPLLLVKMLFKNMYVDTTYTKDIQETD